MQAINQKYKEDCYNCCRGNFLGGNVCKRHMKAEAWDLEDRAQMVPDVTNRSQQKNLDKNFWENLPDVTNQSQQKLQKNTV